MDLDVGFVLRTERESTAAGLPPGSSSEPIRNVWGLVVALESGDDTLTISTALVQRLLAGASRN